MSIDISNSASVDIDHLAKLSRLQLAESEKFKLQGQLERILNHFRALEDVDVSGIEPTAHACDVVNIWDEDEVAEGLTPDQLETIAPAFRDRQIVVPKVVDDA
ncbi:MAG: Asp-tRNA(Asn)/Glu-tRNA(Gln) amidotransferase subunit GatC [Verrucomicrobia bacterium]|nr:Asp-tRNA(Asn)/Glu-tRNA(Gln) amidotransferase subunit GatC [Verrucomicrobiota bacterium]